MNMKKRKRYDVYCGIDVGKTKHYAVALGADGERIEAGPLDQSERAIRDMLGRLSNLGEVLVTVDQFGNIGRLVVAVAKNMGIDVAHITPKSFKEIAETYSEGKSDAKDAFIIADVSLNTPRLIEPVGDRDEVLVEIRILSSRRDDVVRERTQCYNRLHDLLHQACPPLEAIFSKEKLHNDLEIRLLERYGGPQGFKRAGRSRCAKWAGSMKYQANRGPKLVGRVFDALDEMTVTLPGAAVIEEQIKKLAARVIELEAEEAAVNEAMEARSSLIPEVTLLRSIPGIGPVYGATIASEIGDIRRFPSADHLAAYAGVAPVREESGTSVRRTKKRKGGNRRLKNAVIQSAQRARLSDPICGKYYERKRAEGKGHRQAIRALARRRVELIYAILRDGTLYEPPSESRS